MVHPILLVQCRHRLGPHPLAAARGHLAVRDRAVHRPQHRLHQVAAVVHLGHHPVPLPAVQRAHRHAGPALRRQAARVVSEDPQVAVGGLAHRHDAGGVRVLTRRDRGIDRCHHPHQVRHLREAHPEAGGLELSEVPQGAGGVEEQLAVELLAADAGPSVPALHLRDERRGQVGDVVEHPAPGDVHGAVGALGEVHHQRGGPGRAGHDDAGVVAEAGSETDLGPRVEAPPRTGLVGPASTEVPATPPLGLVRGADLDAPALADELAEGAVPRVGDAPAAQHAEQARGAFGHHVAGVRVGGAGGEPVAARSGVFDEVFAAGAGLAPASAGEDEPHVPVAVGAALVGACGGERAGEEGAGEVVPLGVGERADELERVGHAAVSLTSSRTRASSCSWSGVRSGATCSTRSVA